MSPVPAPPPPPSGPPPSKPPRSVMSVRDVLFAVAVLLVIVVLAGGARSCAFAPGGPRVEPGAGPVVDAGARLGEFANASAFPLRVPELPAGWRANSTDRGAIAGGGTAVRVGFLTAEGHYLRLVQSDGAEENLLAAEAGGLLPARGTLDAAGLSWVEYRATEGEPFRVATVPGEPQVRLLITGSGTDEDFRTLAAATLAAVPLPAGTQPG